MTPKNDDMIPTRMTLIERLKQWDDQESWKEFFDRYWRLIYGVGIRSGLTADEAQEVVQETIISVSKNIAKFKADPSFGSFRGWLLNLTRWRILSQVRKRPKVELSRAQMTKNWSSDEQGTATEEKMPDCSGGFEALWDDEWKQNLLRAALERLRREVTARDYQVFHAYVIEGMPAARVAKILGVNIGQVYLIKYRLSRKLKKVIQDIEAARKYA
jgi:RNA polymerase sigma factor (sigma-70 family)